MELELFDTCTCARTGHVATFVHSKVSINYRILKECYISDNGKNNMSTNYHILKRIVITDMDKVSKSVRELTHIERVLYIGHRTTFQK